MSNPTAEPKLLELVKHDGACKELFEACHRRLYQARVAVENAQKEQFKAFKKEVARCRELLDECELIHAEWKKMTRTK